MLGKRGCGRYEDVAREETILGGEPSHQGENEPLMLNVWWLARGECRADRIVGCPSQDFLRRWRWGLSEGTEAFGGEVCVAHWGWCFVDVLVEGFPEGGGPRWAPLTHVGQARPPNPWGRPNRGVGRGNLLEP